MFKTKNSNADVDKDRSPRQFLSEEIIHSSTPDQLRQRSRQPKRIRKPRRVASLAELGFEITLPEEELTNQRLSRGHIGVVFDPGTTDGVELAR